MGLRRLPGLQGSLQRLSDASAAQAPVPGAQPAPGTTDALRTQAAAASGKAAAVGPAAVAGQDQEAERAEVAQAQEATDLARAAAGQAAEGVARAKTQLESATGRELAQLSEQQANQVQEYRQRALGILQNLQQSKGKLSLAREKAATEQAGFLLRQTTKEYVDKLQLEGKRSRLDTDAGFKSALMDTYFRDQRDLLASDLSFRRALGAEKRDFDMWLARMDVNKALDLALGQLQTSNTAAMYSGASSLASAGAKLYASQGAKQEPAASGTASGDGFDNETAGAASATQTPGAGMEA